MQQLRILFYGDGRVDDTPGEFSFGLTDVIAFITQGLKNVVDVEISFVHRHGSYLNPIEGKNKLAWRFLADYDEIWIFADRQENTVLGDVKTDEPYNVLDDYEQRVLREWMKNNGVMLTGDHSEPAGLAPAGVCELDHDKFVGLGAALGRYLPRAHQLRQWDGPPTYCSDGAHDNQNTVEGPDPSQLDTNLELEMDKFPQQLVNPSTRHELFSWVNSAGQVVPIEFFPDHFHEGMVLAPTETELDGDWPQGSPPPEVVASGIDKRPFAAGRVYPLVVAFDGHPVNVGRIVADSTFHHYLNFNLRQINGRSCTGSPLPETALAQIAQYYCNLALWLAPKSIREAIKIDLFFNIATSPLMQRVRGKTLEQVGNTARQVAEIQAGASNLLQILGTPSANGGVIDDVLSDTFLTLATETSLIEQPARPTPERVLGAVVREFNEFFSQQGIRSPRDDGSIPKAEIVRRGFVRAFES
jgi:hypothetical protein